MLPLSSLYYVILMHNSLLFPALSDFISLVHRLEEPVFSSDSSCAVCCRTENPSNLRAAWHSWGWGSVLHPQAELQIQKLLSPGIPAVCHQGQSRKNRRVSICGTRAVIFCHKLQVFMQKIYRKWNRKEKKNPMWALDLFYHSQTRFPRCFPTQRKQQGVKQVQFKSLLMSQIQICSCSICTFINHCSIM